jgi:hypothetical protein
VDCIHLTGEGTEAGSCEHGYEWTLGFLERRKMFFSNLVSHKRLHGFSNFYSIYFVPNF